MTDSTPEWVRNAKAGDKVVRISKPEGWHPTDLILGEVYTIYWIGKVSSIGVRTGKITTSLILRISGHLLNPVNGRDMHYSPEHFRPLITKSTKTGMSILKSLLVSGNVDSEVDA